MALKAINQYEVYDAERREASHAAYVNRCDFPADEAEAQKRGFRHATISEIHASALSAHWALDLYCWRGGLWVKR